MKNIRHTYSTLSFPASRLMLGLMFVCFTINFASALPDTNCNAAFEYENNTQAGSELGTIAFHNVSLGEFTYVQWDFGDGTISNKADKTIFHTYTEEGSFTVSLVIWTANEYCHAKMEESIIISISDTDCSIFDCVFPGDANGDGFADLQDLLHIGMGHGAVGPPRPNSSANWSAQPSFDWDQETADGVNYKHLDCDGNGTISNEDINIVINNYSPMDLDASPLAEGPKARLLFAQDTVYINDTSPETMTLHAVLMLGDNEHPVENLYGVAASLKYDSTVVADQGVLVNYNHNSFLGGAGTVLPYAQNLKSLGQVDLGFSRLDGQNTSGYGRLALVEFVIIVDIIGGRSDTESIFEVPVGGIVAVSNDGYPVSFAVDSEPAKVVFLNDSSTSLEDAAQEKQVRVFPNPDWPVD